MFCEEEKYELEFLFMLLFSDNAKTIEVTFVEKYFRKTTIN